MRRTLWSTLGIVAVLLASRTVSDAQAQTFAIWPGVPPGSEHAMRQEQTVRDTPVGTVVLDVVDPTLTVYLPAGNGSSRTGIIVAPGGYCVALAFDLEGTKVARWLASRGFVAFVLKYRIAKKQQQGVPDVDMDRACKNGMADGVQAVKFVRAHAGRWGISPGRVGFMGFSAGGTIESAALLQPDVAARPDFAAFIYGAPFGAMPVIPANLPPTFMAWAQDDPVALDGIVKFYDALRAAGNKPEAHIFSSGGHGFGLGKNGTTSDRWPDEFYYWMQVRGLAAK